MAVKLLFAEIRYRKVNFLLGLLAVTAAATLFVAGPVLIDGYSSETEDDLARMEQDTKKVTDAMDEQMAQMENETRKLMRNIGFNLVIVHQDTDMSDFWADDFADKDMPEEYVERLAAAPELEHVRHLVATLKQRIKWRDRRVLLSGWLRETPQTHLTVQKKPMGYNIPTGQVYLGYELWKTNDLKAGDEVEVGEHTFQVGKVFPEKGSKEDITIAMNLADAQKVLDKPERINQILALGCQCDEERLPTIRAELESVLKDTKITEYQSIAQARSEQRALVGVKRKEIQKQADQQRAELAAHRQSVQGKMESLATVVTPLVVAACALWIGLLALSNVRERVREIGLLRALGKGSLQIAGLFLDRAVLLGLIGGGLGFLAGSLVAQQVGVRMFEVGADNFSPAYHVLLWSMIGAPLVCAVASYLPTLRAIVQDPAVVLRDA